MKLSIVIPVLNSHEIVRRQLLYFKKMPLPDDAEIILIDDGSEPPLTRNGYGLMNLTILYTNDKRPWTQPIARNMGAKAARGEFLITTDIDHIISKQLIEFSKNSKYDYGRFKREFGIITENGDFTQDVDILKEYGFPTERLKSRGLHLPVHHSMFIRRSVYFDAGGFPEERITYPNREEAVIRQELFRMQAKGKITKCPDDEREIIYMFPNGHYCGDVDYNPFNLFHTLSRKQECQPGI
jgi:glycosyltransferase involved in cell wall biosynthesis